MLQALRSSFGKRTLWLELLEDRIALATRIWSGGGADTNWSTAANWGATGVPAQGDDLQFPATTFLTSNNNLQNLSLNSITFTTGTGYTLTGNAISLTSSLNSNAAGTNRIDFNIQFTLSTPTLSVAAGGALALNGVLSGNATPLKINPGELVLAGNNTFDGGLSLSAGALAVGSNTAVGLGPLTVSGGTTLRADGAARALGNTFSFTGAAPVTFGGSNALTLTGGGSFAAMSVTLNVTNTALTTLAGDLRLGFTSSQLIKTGPGTLALGGTNTYGDTTVSAGTLLVNGVQSGFAVTFGAGATLGGTGTIGQLTSTGGTLSPGATPGSPGRLSTNQVQLSAATTLQIQINGTVPGTDFDLIDARGVFDLAGSTLSATLGFAAAVGTSFTVLGTTGALTGTFNGLPDGTVFAVSGRPFRINYTPNVVTLTRVQGTTTLALAASSAATTFGQPVTFTATVTAQPSGSSTPTGTVTFQEGQTTLGTGTLNAAGQATFTTANLTVGAHSIVAVYGGDADFTGSTSAAQTVTVSPPPARANTTTTVTSLINPVSFGVALLLTATVAPVPPAGGTPTGTVTFVTFPEGQRQNQTTLGTAPLVNGRATVTAANLPIGCQVIVASYSGDANFNPSTSADFRQIVAVTPNQAFVFALYRDVLERAADQSGFTFWVNQLDRGSSRALVATAFWLSAEHRGIQVDTLYRVLLRRAADPGGRAFWTNALVGGMNEAEVAAIFASSAEYAASHPTAAEYVNGLYTDLLGRAADAAGAAFWTQVLQSGARDRAAVAFYFLTTREAYVRALNDYYTIFLGRPADASGLAGLLGALETGSSPAVLAAVFLGSTEYFNRVQIAPCA